MGRFWIHQVFGWLSTTWSRPMSLPCFLCCGTCQGKTGQDPQIYTMWSENFPPIGLVCLILKAFFGLMAFQEVHQILGSTLFAVSRCSPPWSPSSYALPPSAPWTSICCQTCKIPNWTQTVNAVGFSHHRCSSSRNSLRDIHPLHPSIHSTFLSLWA